MQPREGYDCLDDVGLMRGIATRDPNAMAALFDRHAARVLAACLHVVQNRSDAEDALENVFFELWQHAERFDATRGNPRAYLEVLARSRALDLVRARSRAERRVLDAQNAGALSEPGRETPAPLSSLLDQERRQTLRKAVGGLSPTQRQVIEMAFFQGMTHAEVAENLDLPLGTVKARIRAGLHLLRRPLGSRAVDREEGS